MSRPEALCPWRVGRVDGREVERIFDGRVVKHRARRAETRRRPGMTEYASNNDCEHDCHVGGHQVYVVLQYVHTTTHAQRQGRRAAETSKNGQSGSARGPTLAQPSVASQNMSLHFTCNILHESKCVKLLSLKV